MIALNVFIENYVPMDLRTGRSFTGPRGWVHLVNQALRRFESEGLVSLTQKKEIGVEVNNGRWITLPSDYRDGLSVEHPTIDNLYYPFEIVNGKIRLFDDIRKSDDPEAFALSNGTASQVEINSSVAVKDQYKNFLLVLTNGTYSGDSMIIGEHNAASGGVTVLPFLHSRNTSIADSTAGYLTDLFVVLRYMARFTGLTSHTDILPIDEKYFEAIVLFISYMSKPVTSKDRGGYREEFEFELDVLRNEEFTPNPDQARPLPRSMAAFEDCSNFEKPLPIELEEYND